MRKLVFAICLITFSCIESYSQIIFEKGYFINESNSKTECLIKNIDWKNNPTEFEYRLSPNEPVQKASINTVKEFGINNVSKYIRTKTNIDRSSEQIEKMSSERDPLFQEELLFLKVLIEGKASLFHYNDGNLTRFFYEANGSGINQLVYKKYLIADKVSENNEFKQQLFQQLKCEGIGIDEIRRLKYSKRDLEKLFIKYNECISHNYINFNPKQKSDLFNLTIRPGINYSSLEIQNSLTGLDYTDFGSKAGIRLGVEAEFILPFNKNKWSLIFEPTYQQYKSEQSEESITVLGGVVISKVDYKSIEFPVGLRHHLYLNDRSKLFANVSYVFSYDRKSTINFLRKDNSMLSSLDIKANPAVAFGLGYKYKDKYGVEMRYGTRRNILGGYSYWNSYFNTISVAFGYSLF